MSTTKSATKLLHGKLLITITAALALFVIIACTPPGSSEPEATAVPFEPTPYEAAVDDSEADAEAEPVASDDAAVGDESESADEDMAEDETDAASTDSVSSSASTSSASTAALNYKGEIMPDSRVTVVAESNGMVLEFNAEISDKVSVGDVLAVIDSAMLEAQRAQALAGLTAAQAQLDLTLDTATDEDLEAARAGVAAARAAYARALEGPTAEDERMALAGLKQAEAGVTVAQAGYNRVKGNPLIGAMPESLQLQQATLGLESAQAQYDKLLKGSTSDVIAGAYAQLAQARAQLQRLEDGAKDAQVQAAEAQVKQAETALYMAQLQLDKATVYSTVDGIITELHTAEGAMIAPGSPVVGVRSEDVKVIVAIEESRIREVAMGQAAEIRVDAYPGRIFNGEVTVIAPEFDPATRTVAVTIQPDSEDGLDLAPGMFASVELLK